MRIPLDDPMEPMLMIEARADTIMRGVEYVGGGLSGEELTKRKRWVKQGGKKKCKGCISMVNSYNRDHRGHVETLCYNCRSKVGYPTREYTYKEEDKKRDYTCKNGHDKAKEGTTDRGGCLKCATNSAQARWERTVANRANPDHVRKDSRLALRGLAGLIEERGVSFKAVERKTGIPAATIGGYAKVVPPKGYKCPPDRAERIAGYFRLDSVAELTGEGA